MIKATSTYNFAPLAPIVYIPEWGNQVTQDIPFSDGEDGTIEVEIENLSPLFTRDGNMASRDSADAGKNASPYSAHIQMPDGKRLYYLPATSVKGMLRNLTEILSLGKMRQYDDRFFGHREFDRKFAEYKSYMKQMEGVKVGWLSKQNDTYYLSPCKGEVNKISHTEIRRYFPSFKGNSANSWDNNHLNGEMYPLIKKGEKSYHLVCTGKMNSKKNEYLVPVDCSETIEVSSEVAKSFETVHMETPNFDKYLDRLDDGKEIAVFYIGSGNDIKCIGLSRMLKLPYQRSVRKLVETSKKYIMNGMEVDGDKYPDFSEIIWGYTNSQMDKKSLKGRIHVSNAFATEPTPDNKLMEVKGILGQPKPTFYPYYLLQDASEYKTFNIAKDIAGRKLYRVHALSNITPLPQRYADEQDKKDNVSTKFKAIPKGQTFTLTIHVHNLRPVEIGLLLSALTLHKSDASFLNIGLAKGFGYGKLKIKEVKTDGLNKSAIDYMKDFERLMNEFVKKYYKNRKWSDLEQVRAAMNILGEHDDEDVQMPKLDNGNPVPKLKNDFRLLSKSNLKLEERDVNFTTLVDDAAEAKAANCNLYENKINELKILFEQKQYEQVYSVCVKTIDELSARSEEYLSPYITQITEIKTKCAQAQEDEKRKKEEELRRAKSEAGLLANLNEKYEMGPNNGSYKVNSFSTLKSKVVQWIRNRMRDDQSYSSLTQQEKIDLVEVIRRLKEEPVKKEKKDWDNPNSNLWKTIRQWLGEDWTGFPFN